MNDIDPRALGQKMLVHLRSIAAKGGKAAGKSTSAKKVAACRKNWLKAQAAIRAKREQNIKNENE